MRECRACKNAVYETADACPHCGAKNPGLSNNANAFGVIVGVIIFIAFAWYLFGGGIETEVAEDCIKQYEMTKQNGDKVETYVRASLVAEAYLQAGDEANYKKWKAIETKEARRAGMPSGF